MTVHTSLPGSMRSSLLGYWQQARPAQRFGYLVGGALVLAGLAHLAAWLVAGGAWAGPVSFRKPTTFGISFGLTTIAVAWLVGQLRVSHRTGWLLLGSLAAADTYEVAWVSVQRWRRLPFQLRHNPGLRAVPAGWGRHPDRGHGRPGSGGAGVHRPAAGNPTGGQGKASPIR